MQPPNSISKAKAESLLRQMLGADKSFRDGQWEAIEAIAVRNHRLMVVQRTGWGKSIVYFIATSNSGPVFPFALAKATAGDS